MPKDGDPRISPHAPLPSILQHQWSRGIAHYRNRLERESKSRGSVCTVHIDDRSCHGKDWTWFCGKTGVEASTTSSKYHKFNGRRRASDKTIVMTAEGRRNGFCFLRKTPAPPYTATHPTINTLSPTHCLDIGVSPGAARP